MRSALKTVVVALAVVVTGWSALAQTSPQPYLPLARADITASGNDVDRLLSVLREFSRAQKLVFRGGNFPKQGRSVTNVGLYFRSPNDSHFSVINFIQADQFQLIAYSHDEERVWRMPWNELLTKIRSELGEARVTVIIP